MVVRKKSKLLAHRDKECDCYDVNMKNSDKSCIYQVFLDDMDFTPDAGNGQSRGEVFTPKFIVDKMIAESGMLPKAAVYDKNYTSYTKEEIETYINNRIIEPAVGTGNFTTTILYHKINLVGSLINNFYQELDEDAKTREYNSWLLKAVSSMYAFDIDAGNIQTTLCRIMGLKKPMNDQDNKNKWFNHIKQGLSKESQSIENIDNIIKTVVESSLNDAENHWEESLNNVGIVEKLYEEHLGKSITDSFVDHLWFVLNDNFKLFNGIVEEDTVKDDFVVPGYHGVVWRFWSNHVDGKNIVLNFEEVPLTEQLNYSKTKTLEQEMSIFKKEHYVSSGDGLFAIEKWDTPANERQYKKMLKEYNKLSGN